MKNVLFTILMAVACFYCTHAQMHEESSELTQIQTELSSLRNSQATQKEEIIRISNKAHKNEINCSTLEARCSLLSDKVDSLQNECEALAEVQKADTHELSSNISSTNSKIQYTNEVLSSRTLFGVLAIIILLIALVGLIWTFIRKFRSGSSSIDDVRKAQTALAAAQEDICKAQKKMQEESIHLDNKLIELLSKQSISAPIATETGEIDHSLTLKVADEIVKIEMNLSHMDKSIKGYKQLEKGVQRIKDNFKANDYEIVDMLGKQYTPGMKAAVTFVTDETLEAGQQIITRIIKPQVNYKQIMIQAAQIEVSQSE